MQRKISAIIDPSDVFKIVSGSSNETNEGIKGAIVITPSSTKAICHSHPKGGDYSAAPGYGDDGVVNGGYPNYIVRNGTVGVVERLRAIPVPHFAGQAQSTGTACNSR